MVGVRGPVYADDAYDLVHGASVDVAVFAPVLVGPDDRYVLVVSTMGPAVKEAATGLTL